MVRRRVILVIRDGWGYTEEKKGNATYLAETPNDDYFRSHYPSTLLKCTGNSVGLPEGTQGGSEPGHLIMGAGRIVWQPLEKINMSIRDGSFNSSKPFLDAINYCRKHEGNLHLAGLFSDQGIHGTISHLYAILKLAKIENFENVFVHCFLDGRDVPERSALKFLKISLEKFKKIGIGKIASLVGRYYSMDRDTNWDRTRKAYDLLTLGEGNKQKDPIEGIKRAYEREKVSDYYIQPIVIVDELNQPIATVSDDDSFIFWNFRSDRARQLTYALTQKDFKRFTRRKIPDIFFAAMSVYDPTLNLPAAYPQHFVKNNLGCVLSSAGLRQLRIAETEKYAHVTYFFNSQVEKPYKGEDRILVPSPKVPNYEDKPEMSAYEITKKLIPKIKQYCYDFILVNFANGDLVGHSANLEAGIEACEVVDECVGRVVQMGLEKDYCILLTGDHGNIETMLYPDGSPNPSHGLNPVPLILISREEALIKNELMEKQGLSCISPSILKLMSLERPPEMVSNDLLK
jgi:2,3-bisphosphoglycerate-independent phosphoglycerate mutase